MFQDLLDTQDAPLERFLWNSIIPSLLITSLLHADVVWGRHTRQAPRGLNANHWVVIPLCSVVPEHGVRVPDIGREPSIQVGPARVVRVGELWVWGSGDDIPIQRHLWVRSAGVTAYPRSLMLAGIQGTVFVHAVVDESGMAQTWIQSSYTRHDPELLQVALLAVSRVRFQPARLAGNAVEAVVEIPVEFVIPN